MAQKLRGDPFDAEPFVTKVPGPVRMGNDVAFDTPVGVGAGYKQIGKAGTNGVHGSANPGSPPSRPPGGDVMGRG